MPRFYADHNVSTHTASALRRRGHDVTMAREIHQERAADYRQLLVAAEESRILITHNERDFSLLHGAWLLWTAAWAVAPQHSGILSFPQWRPTLQDWDSEDAAEQLTTFVEQHPSLANQLYVWRRGSGWQPPRL